MARSLAVGGTAISKLFTKSYQGSDYCGNMLEADDSDVEFKDASTVAELTKKKPLERLRRLLMCLTTFLMTDLNGLEETSFYDPLNFTYPAGAHIAEVEIDPHTRVVNIVDWVCCDDFGNLINPMIVEGRFMVASPKG